MLLLNRRGFAPSVRCRRCGELVSCPNCSIGLTYHRTDDRMLCHYCGHRARLASACPACGSPSLGTRGAGIQRLEQELHDTFPETQVVRMDADTTGRKGAHDRLLRTFQLGQARILIGTQMIAKGHHFPLVTLAGILNIDDVAGLPDFRSGERAMQLLWQMAGRAGRGELAGTVMVQTRMAGLPMLALARDQDYRRFLEAELEARRLACYPPYTNIVLITVAAGDSDTAEARAAAIAKDLAASSGGAEVLGPAPSPIHQLRGRFRWQLLAKHPDLEALVAACRTLASLTRRERGTTVTADVEPVSTL
jgi:primosomal protein N' (replication factor Y)